MVGNHREPVSHSSRAAFQAETARSSVDAILEPVVRVDVLVPREHLGACLETLEGARGKQVFFDAACLDGRARLVYECPWALVVDGLTEALAHATQGYASLSVQSSPHYAPADVCKVDVAIQGGKRVQNG